MSRLRILVRMSYAAGMLVLVSVVLSITALSDITRGEPDTGLEWGMLRVTALLIVMHLGLTFALLRHVSKQLDNGPA